MQQRTLAAPLHFEGIGLHSGVGVRCTLHPAAADHGVVLWRADLPDAPPIPAHVDHVVGTQLATTLGVDGAQVGTVEHLLAAVRGMGVDNVRVLVHGPELPVLDGSAGPFVEAIRAVGVEQQAAEARLLRVVERVELVEPGTGRQSLLEPLDDFEIDCEIAFDHPLLEHQSIHFRWAAERFADEIAPARTFGLLADVERMHAAGLALGGGLENAVVFGDEDVLNPGGLRFADECVRHKVLDMIGDISLLGAPVLGRFRARRSGHAFNLRLVRAAIERGAVVPVEPRSQPLSASG